MLFDKKKNQCDIQLVTGLLNAQDTDMIVVRGKECQLLYMNDAARKRQNTPEWVLSCKRGYQESFPGLCEGCPLNSDEPDEPADFEVKDAEGRYFAANCRPVQWLDGKPAVAIYLRDVDAERSAREKLYNLAYMDHLTGVPNRQKFKEDFEAMAEDIAADKRTGAMAIFDLDNFKSVNDTYGHNTGDLMLKRLTEHLAADKAFAGHLYRLGGDEFILLYADPPDRFPNEDARREFYGKLLQSAFMAYSMPNIEISCTISMGVAFFPEHGTSYSDLLRKADIALYKAKAGGRNQLVFFEDQYDAAKKFKDLYINIQPILTHLGRTYGYELVDRGNENGDVNELNLSEFDRTMDALGLGEMESEARYFIGYTPQLMSKTVLNMLPRDKFIIQVSPRAGTGPVETERYRQLRLHGYSLALTGLDGVNAPAALMELADYCKFDPDVDYVTQKRMIAANPGKRFIATGVDSVAHFNEAKAAGFKLFQGYFFNQPVVVKKTKDIDPLKVNYLRLLKLTSTDDYVDFKEISGVIGADVALSYKLLRLLNSPAVGLRNKISSIEMGVAYLGEESLKKWIAMLALRGIADDKPLELVRMSLIRAQFGELLAPMFAPKRDERHVFLTGMFSLLHIALEKTKEEVMEEIPVADDIRLSLLTDNGPHSDLLAFYQDYEYANWDEVSHFAREHSLSDKAINDAYIRAVKWYNDLTEVGE